MLVSIVLLLLLLVFSCHAFYLSQTRPTWFSSIRAAQKGISEPPKLLTDPNPNSIGNFFENKTEETSFIQCYMLALGEIGGEQYGVGFPIDMPVSLTYFEGTELKPVKEDYPDFDHLVNHVSVQLENNDLFLYKTPVVLTLQGEFEEDDMNEVYTPTKRRNGRAELEEYRSSTRFEGTGVDSDAEDDDEGDDDSEAEEVSIADIIELEGLDNEDQYDDDEDDDEFPEDEGEEQEEEEEEENLKSFWNSSPAGKNDQMSSVPDLSIYRPEKPDLSDIPADAIVTDDDTKGLRRAHKKADRIIQYADDIKLIASFHYKKKNFHLVKLLEPMFLVGKRIMDIKGYYFTLLNDEDSAKVPLTILLTSS